MRIIAVTNHKGGSGKSTVALNLASCLSHRGFTVALGDLDLDQGTAVEWAELLDSPAFDVYPVRADELHGFLEHLDEGDQSYDYVILDCPPKADLDADRILSVAEMALVPMNPSFADFRATKKLLNLIRGRVDAMAKKHGKHFAWPKTALVLSQTVKGEAINRRVREACAADDGFDYPLLGAEFRRYQVYRAIYETGHTIYTQPKLSPNGHAAAVDHVEQVTDEVLEVLNGS